MANQGKSSTTVKRQRKPKEFQSLIDFLKKKVEADTEFFIFCHDNPDPDCMASALAAKAIADKYERKSTIVYSGEITHTQNKAMINVLDIKMVRVEDMETEAKEAFEARLKAPNVIIMAVDTSCWNSGNCRSIGRFRDVGIEAPHIVIDHHEPTPASEKAQVYIHKRTGSCASIMLRVLGDLGVKFDNLLATALFLGLMKDTDDMNATHLLDEWDHDANDILRERFDFDTYMRIVNCPRPRTLIDLEGLAKGRYLRQEGNTVISGVGIIKPIYKALLAEICDDMMSHDQVEKCLILGITDDGVVGSSKKLVAAFRNTGDIIDTNAFVQQIFGKEGSGGRKGAGGALIDLGPVLSMTIDGASEEDKVKIFQMILKAYSQRALNEIEV